MIFDIKNSIPLLLGFSIFILTCYDIYSLQVSPQRYELFLSDGEEQEIRFRVVNDKDFEQEILISSRPWHILKENRHICTSEWFTYTPDKLILKPKQEAFLTCKVKCPRNAIGFLNNVISFTENYKYGGAISVVISVPIYVIIKDKAYFEIDISSVAYRSNPFSNKDEILITIENKGNVYIRPKGRVQITRGKQLVFLYNFPETYPIFVAEKGILVLPYEIKKPLSDGRYKILLELDLWDIAKLKKEKNIYIKKGVWKLEN